MAGTSRCEPLLLVLKCRREANSHEQAFRTQEPSGDLAPRLRAGSVNQVVVLGGQLIGRSGNVGHLELDTGLRNRDLSRPLRGSEAGSRRLGEGPQSKVFCPFKLVSEQVVALVALEVKTQST